MLKKILQAKPYIIAEIGANHNGDINKAFYLIKSAKKAGCDAVKFQSWNENLNCSSYYKKNKKDLLEYLKYKLSFNQLKKLREFSKKLNIHFGTTPFSNEQLKEAVKLKCDFIKVASMDLNNYPFINKVSLIKENLIVSTGFSTLDEIKKASKILKKNKKKNVVFLHCVGLYPPKSEDVINLKNMKIIKKVTGYEIGFSDHTRWFETPLAASALGAKVIEKHFTFNKKAKGWDHSVSADYKEMKNLVISSKRAYKLSGKLNRKLSKEEIKKSKIMRRSVTLKNNLKKDQKISLQDLDLQRPGIGIAPIYLNKVLNKKIKKDLFSGEILKWNQIK
jgi:N-acetylneuraminate synthase